MLQKKDFYFVRHGESLHNQMDICTGGQIDSPLSAQGIEQAKNLGMLLETIDIDFAVTSPMIRAKKTAEIAYTGKIIADENLRECNLGDFEGQKGDRKIIEYLKNAPFDEPIPNGEEKGAFCNRIVQCFNHWLSNDNANILFVAHGFVYAAILRAIEATNYDLDNCQLVHFHVNDSGTWETHLIR